MRESAAVERAVALYQSGGMTIAAAAAEAGVDRVTLTRALRRRGVPPALGGRPPAPPPPMPEPYYFADGTPLVVKRKPARRYKP